MNSGNAPVISETHIVIFSLPKTDIIDKSCCKLGTINDDANQNLEALHANI